MCATGYVIDRHGRSPLARVADNHHYFSDVVAGAVLGTVIGHLVTHAP